MGDRLKLYQFLLAIIFIPICLFILATYGWIGYATLTERPGLNGDYYHYYNLTRPQFYIYNFAVAVIALGLIIFQAKYIIDKNSKHLTKTFWTLALFIGVIIICETYLQTRFTGKG